MTPSLSGYGMSGNKIPKGYQMAQTQNFTPEQVQLFGQIFGNVGPESYLGKLSSGDQSTFDQIEKPALQQFAGLQGNIASRFSGMGSGARNSSGFQNTMNQASSDFAQQLQSNRQGLQRQALMDMMGISESLLNQRPYEQQLLQEPQKQKNPSFWQSLGLGLGGGLGSLAGNSFGKSFGSLFN